VPPPELDNAQQVLVRACAQSAVCERLETQLRTLRSQEPPDSEAMAAAKSFTQLLTTLRARPHSRIVPKIAGRQITKVRTVRPWEVTDSDG
jgi:hypothetical protein